MNAVAVIVGLIAVAALYVLVPVAIDGYFAYWRARSVQCPTAGSNAEVKIPAWRGMASPFGIVIGQFPVSRCSLWPGRGGCDQSCLKAR